MYRPVRPTRRYESGLHRTLRCRSSIWATWREECRCQTTVLLRRRPRSERITNGSTYREEISRYVRQQVTAASPFECLCIPAPPAANESTAADASRLRPLWSDSPKLCREALPSFCRATASISTRWDSTHSRRCGGMCMRSRCTIGTARDFRVGSSRRSSIGWSASMRSRCIGQMGGTRTREFSF